MVVRFIWVSYSPVYSIVSLFVRDNRYEQVPAAKGRMLAWPGKSPQLALQTISQVYWMIGPSGPRGLNLEAGPCYPRHPEQRTSTKGIQDILDIGHELFICPWTHVLLYGGAVAII